MKDHKIDPGSSPGMPNMVSNGIILGVFALLHRGTEVARLAHNQEVSGSKPLDVIHICGQMVIYMF